MTTVAHSAPAATRQVFLSQDDCRLEDFTALIEAGTDIADYPYADAVNKGVLIYSDRLQSSLDTEGERRDVQAEIARALSDGPGIVVFKHAFDPDLIDRATAAFFELLAQDKEAGVVAGDHFAKPGANDRVWNALEKLAVTDPALFAEYFANDYVALASGAWLGPNYQMTAALNIVNPGGQAQVPHRDYHLGFMPLETAAAFPAHVHRLSPVLTLQGAVAHCDMPVETGPTLYLPHSHKYLPGYLAFSLPEFQDYFRQNYVQQSLEKGDAVFFNPGLMHGAGTNRTADVRRMANLLQVSSAFGRPLEAVDTARITKAVYPTLLAKSQGATGADGASDTGIARWIDNVVTVAAEGYPFPTNLDRDHPSGSMNPESQADLVRRALREGWDSEQLDREVDAGVVRKQTA